MDVEDVLLGNCSDHFVTVMGSVSFLLHCNASNLVIEILKHDKIWGTIALASAISNSAELVYMRTNHSLTVVL